MICSVPRRKENKKQSGCPGPSVKWKVTAECLESTSQLIKQRSSESAGGGSNFQQPNDKFSYTNFHIA